MEWLKDTFFWRHPYHRWWKMWYIWERDYWLLSDRCLSYFVGWWLAIGRGLQQFNAMSLFSMAESHSFLVRDFCQMILYHHSLKWMCNCLSFLPSRCSLSRKLCLLTNYVLALVSAICPLWLLVRLDKLFVPSGRWLMDSYSCITHLSTTCVAAQVSAICPPGVCTSAQLRFGFGIFSFTSFFCMC